MILVTGATGNVGWEVTAQLVSAGFPRARVRPRSPKGPRAGRCGACADRWQVLSRAGQVQLIGEAIGRPLRFEKVPVPVARKRMLADHRPSALVEALWPVQKRDLPPM